MLNTKQFDKDDTKHTNDMLLALYEYIEKNILNNKKVGKVANFFFY